MTPLDSIWPIQRWLDSYNRLHSYVNYESAGWHFVHTCAGWRKRRVWKCCAIAGSELLRLYVQILVVLVDGKHCWWSEGSTVRGVIRVQVVTSAGVTGWNLPRTGWRSITVDGCGLLCVLLRLHSYSFHRIWQEPFEEVAERRAGVKRSETNERRKFANPSCRTQLGEAQFKREPQHGANKEADVEQAGSKTQCKQI